MGYCAVFTAGPKRTITFPGRIAQFWDRILDEARKDTTYRKITEGREEKEKGRDPDRPRPKPRKR